MRNIDRCSFAIEMAVLLAVWACVWSSMAVYQLPSCDCCDIADVPHTLVPLVCVHMHGGFNCIDD